MEVLVKHLGPRALQTRLWWRRFRYRAAVSPGGPRGPEALSRSSRGESGASIGCKGALQERKVERGGTEAEVERASHRGRRSLEASEGI